MDGAMDGEDRRYERQLNHSKEGEEEEGKDIGNGGIVRGWWGKGRKKVWAKFGVEKSS